MFRIKQKTSGLLLILVVDLFYPSSMRLKIVIIAALVCFFVAHQNVWAQEDAKAAFSADSSLFINNLTEYFKKVGDNHREEANEVLARFSRNWNTNVFTYAQKRQITGMCIGMDELHIPVDPYFIYYLRSVDRLLAKMPDIQGFEAYQRSIKYCFDNPPSERKLFQYLTQTDLLLEQNAFMKTTGEAWYLRNASWKIAFEVEPVVKVSTANLVCAVRYDSALIYNTKGIFYPLTQKWIGKGGKVTWERAGLSPKEVYATLSNYQIDTRTITYSADSVEMYHGGYFKTTLLGKLEDKAMADVNPDLLTYPKFSMYQGSKVYINLFKTMQFSGSFNLEGSRVMGRSSKSGPATIEITKDHNLFVSLTSPEFVIRPDRFITKQARAVIFLENDSIFHPGLQVRYSMADNELVFTRSDEGLALSPFFNSYHKLDMFNEAVYWKLGENKMDFESIRGLHTQSDALFQSADYYSMALYDKFKGIDDAHPATLLSTFVRKRGVKQFVTQDYADWLRKPYQQAKAQLIRMANAGFIVYDSETEIATTQPRLNEFLAANSGVKDSDIIQFQSSVEKGNNAQLDLKTMLLAIQGVKQVMLSDSQYVYVVPRDGKVVVAKNRDFSFTGRVHAGLCDFLANECTFQYNKFMLSMPKIDSVQMIAASWDVDEQGRHTYPKVKNVISNMNADLVIDAPDSKSGRKMLHNYPVLISKDTSMVYFNRKEIMDGLYKRNNFYFAVDPFTMDSLNSIPTAQVRFDGQLVSAGIFPPFREELKIQKDYSLGFRKLIAGQGLAAYGGKGMFSDTLKLDNSGLRGSGKLAYLSSDTRSTDILFMPDSAVAKVKDYNLAQVTGKVEFPDAQLKSGSIVWLPNDDKMLVNNDKDIPFKMFNDKATLSGCLAVSPQGLRGKGVFNFENMEVVSNAYGFKNQSFNTENADVRLFTDDRKAETLKVHSYRSDVDFASRRAHFETNSKDAKMELPLIKYNCVVDAFDWKMDEKQLELYNSEKIERANYIKMKPEELIAFDAGNAVYSSTDPRQKGLNFFAMRSVYDMRENTLEVQDARILKIADAAILPLGGKLTIQSDGQMAQLKNATILANRSALLFKFFNATVNVGSSEKYTAKGLYDYVPADGEPFTLAMDNIMVNSEGATTAGTHIADTNFMINHYFKYRGDISLNAASTMVRFDGGYQMLLSECKKFIPEWVKIHAEVDPKNVMIPVSDDNENTGNGNLRVSMYYSLTENTLLPGFFSKAENVTDPDVVAATGYLVFDPKKSEYIVASAEKLKDSLAAGNILRLNTSNCVYKGEGNLQLAVNLGQLKMHSIGQLVYYSLIDTTKVNAFSSFDFFFADEAMKVMANALNMSNLKGIDIGSGNHARAMRALLGAEAAAQLMSELGTYGQYRKFPDALNHTMALTDVNLVWNNDTRSFISKGLIGISNLGTIPINKYVKGYVEYGKRRSGDIINIYLEPADSHWYFFTYSNGTMQAISSNKDFNDKLVGLKESQRVIKAERGLPSYQFIVGTEEKKASFMRKMRQAEASASETED